MIQTEFGGVQHRSPRPTAIRERLVVKRPIVDVFSAQGRAGFTQMDADLVCSSCLQPAFDERIVAQIFDDADVRDSAFAHSFPPLP